MTITPIARSDKVNAATFNLRFDEIESELNSLIRYALEEIVALTHFDGLTNGVTLSAIPQTYRALLLVTGLNEPGSSTINNLRFNGDSGTNYHQVEVGAFASASPTAATTTFSLFCNSTGSQLAINEMWLFNYTGTYTTMLMRKFRQATGFTNSYTGGTYTGTAPVTSIAYAAPAPVTAASFYALYGMKG